MSATFRLTCPYCGEPTRAPLLAFFRWWPNEGGKTEAEKRALEKLPATAAASSYCPECEGLISLMIQGEPDLLRNIMSGDIGISDYDYYETDLRLLSHYPQSYAEKISESVPPLIRQVFPDMIEDVARNRNSAAVLTSCRGVLEVALQGLETRSGALQSKAPLVKRIDQLADRGLITSGLAEWAHQIRLDGNRSAHELIGDPAVAKAYVDFLKLFLEVSFDLPERIKKMKSAREEPVLKPKIRGRAD